MRPVTIDIEHSIAWGWGWRIARESRRSGQTWTWTSGKASKEEAIASARIAWPPCVIRDLSGDVLP